MELEVCDIVKNVRNICKTNNPFEICKKLDIKIKFVNYGHAFYLADINCIFINEKYTKDEQLIICAHELGHAMCHCTDGINHFGRELKTLESINKEYEANLFAAYLLFDDKNLDLKFNNMNSYLLSDFLQKKGLPVS